MKVSSELGRSPVAEPTLGAGGPEAGNAGAATLAWNWLASWAATKRAISQWSTTAAAWAVGGGEGLHATGLPLFSWRSCPCEYWQNGYRPICLTNCILGTNAKRGIHTDAFGLGYSGLCRTKRGENGAGHFWVYWEVVSQRWAGCPVDGQFG